MATQLPQQVIEAVQHSRDQMLQSAPHIYIDSVSGHISLSGTSQQIQSFIDRLYQELPNHLIASLSINSEKVTLLQGEMEQDTAELPQFQRIDREAAERSTASRAEKQQEGTGAPTVKSAGSSQLVGEAIELDMPETRVIGSPIVVAQIRALSASEQFGFMLEQQEKQSERQSVIEEISSALSQKQITILTDVTAQQNIVAIEALLRGQVKPVASASAEPLPVSFMPEPEIIPPIQDPLPDSEEPMITPAPLPTGGSGGGGGGSSPPSNTAPVATDDTGFTVTQDTNLVITAATQLLANDTDADGDALSISAFDAVSANGGTIVDNGDGTFTYTPAAGYTGADSFTYTVSDGNGSTDDATVNLQVNGLLTNGLVMHFETVVSLGGVQATGNDVTEWRDLSGSGNHLQAFGDPRIGTVTTPNGQRAIEFDGTGAYLRNSNPIADAPSGNADRTMFFVVDYQNSSAFAGAGYGRASSNETFNLAISNNANGSAYTLQGWPQSNDKITSINAIGDGIGNDEFVIQSVTLFGNTYNHFINGVLVDSGIHIYNTNTTLGSIRIASRIDGGAYIQLNTAALLVYDRALTETERLQVEQYLQDTYLRTNTVTTINGNNSGEWIIGNTGKDSITGGTANDSIAGGGGLDTLSGGAGDDQFIYNAATDSGIGSGNRDIITDFIQGDDQINVESLASFTIASADNTAGNGIADFTGGGTAEIAWQQIATNTIVMFDTNGDGTANLEIELTGLHTLTTTTFIL